MIVLDGETTSKTLSKGGRGGMSQTKGCVGPNILIFVCVLELYMVIFLKIRQSVIEKRVLALQLERKSGMGDPGDMGLALFCLASTPGAPC